MGVEGSKGGGSGDIQSITPPNARVKTEQTTITPAKADVENLFEIADGDCGSGSPVMDGVGASDPIEFLVVWAAVILGGNGAIVV